MWRQYSTLRQPLTVLVSNQLKHASFKQKGLANIQTRFRHAKSKNVEKLLGDDNSTFSVRPMAFWSDKILEKEIQKQVPSTPPKPRVLVEKKMMDSYIQEYLPFKSSPELLEEYIFTNGNIRTGKLLEDLDALAGAIAYKHIGNGDLDASPVTIVTASVDRLDLYLPKANIVDYKLSGHVTYVGNSSMEVFIKAEIVDDMEKDKPKDPESLVVLGKNTVLATRFTMVAIDSATRKPVKINPLLTTSPAEERLFEMGEINKKRKKQYAEISLSRQPPTPEERLAIHDVYLQYSKYAESSGQDGFATPKNHEALQNLPNNLVWMRNTTIESNYLMMPQDRNIHNNIFGGYLMRRAYELAYADASLFMKSASPIMLSMDEVTFRKPVHVGSLLNLSSTVVLSEGYPHSSVQVRVVAEVIDFEKNTREMTNIFHFTLQTDDRKLKLRQILPKTYEETMLWLDAKRRRTHGIHARNMISRETDF